MDDLKIFSGNSNRPLAEQICMKLGLKLGDAYLAKFPDGEICFQIMENVRGMDVFIVQSTCPPVDSNLMELLVMIDAFKRSSARRITAVIPYFGYGRQDRKDKPRVPISSKLVADLITVAGAGRVLAMDLHAGQIQGFFNIPFDHLFAAPIFVEYFRKHDAASDLVVVSPDAGGVERARAYAKRLKADLALCDKRRDKSHAGHSDAEVMNIVGEVAGHSVLVVDDMVDTAGSLSKVAEALVRNGAREVRAACTHAVLSGSAIERLEKSPIKEVVVTDTIPLKTAKPPSKLKTLPVAPLLAEAIQSIHDETSVSSLFI